MLKAMKREGRNKEKVGLGRIKKEGKRGKRHTILYRYKCIYSEP